MPEMIKQANKLKVKESIKYINKDIEKVDFKKCDL